MEHVTPRISEYNDHMRYKFEVERARFAMEILRIEKKIRRYTYKAKNGGKSWFMNPETKIRKLQEEKESLELELRRLDDWILQHESIVKQINGIQDPEDIKEKITLLKREFTMRLAQARSLHSQIILMSKELSEAEEKRKGGVKSNADFLKESVEKRAA
jgi:hypothetical protein